MRNKSIFFCSLSWYALHLFHLSLSFMFHLHAQQKPHLFWSACACQVRIKSLHTAYGERSCHNITVLHLFSTPSSQHLRCQSFFLSVWIASNAAGLHSTHPQYSASRFSFSQRLLHSSGRDDEKWTVTKALSNIYRKFYSIYLKISWRALCKRWHDACGEWPALKLHWPANTLLISAAHKWADDGFLAAGFPSCEYTQWILSVCSTRAVGKAVHW